MKIIKEEWANKNTHSPSNSFGGRWVSASLTRKLSVTSSWGDPRPRSTKECCWPPSHSFFEQRDSLFKVFKTFNSSVDFSKHSCAANNKGLASYTSHTSKCNIFFLRTVRNTNLRWKTYPTWNLLQWEYHSKYQLILLNVILKLNYKKINNSVSIIRDLIINLFFKLF